jgi:UDP-N-acetylglucosamine 2-epimerase
MFESTYGLSAPPFQLNPDPEFYFSSRGHDRAQQYLRFGVYQGEGFIVITGDIGAGKTTLVRTMLAELDPNKVVAAQLVSTQLEASDLLRAVAMAFGVPAKGATKAEVLGSLEAYFTTLALEGKRALLVIDEAQNVPIAAVEELRMISNFQYGNRTLLQSFLVGQPELRDMLRLPGMEQLRQRVIASCHLGPMESDETRGYIEHRLKRVAWNDDPHFSDEAFAAIHRWTNGVPRRINMLCNRLMLNSFLAGSHVIELADVESVASEIRAEIGGTHAIDMVVEAAPTITEPTREVRRARLPGAVPAHEAPAGVFRGSEDAQIRSTEVSPGVWQSRAVVPLPREPGPILCVCASRANLQTMGPLIEALESHKNLPDVLLVHIDHSPDEALDDPYFAGLEIPAPHFTLVVQRGSESLQTAELMKCVESIVDVYAPSAIILVGDGHALLACSLVADAREICLLHVDAGVRSSDRASSWDINRLLIDQTSDVHFTAERSAQINLTQEGVRTEHVYFVGHLLSDSLLAAAPRAIEPATTLAEAGVAEKALDLTGKFGLVGINCPPDIHNRAVFEEIVSMLRKMSKVIPLVWPMQEQTKASFERHGLMADLKKARIVCIDPLPFLKMVGLMKASTCVITDSRFTQDEAATLGVPCLTLRPEATRRVTVEQGSNSVIGFSLKRLMAELSEILDTGGKRGQIPELWDGHAAVRIADQVARLRLTRGRVVLAASVAAPAARGAAARAK